MSIVELEKYVVKKWADQLYFLSKNYENTNDDNAIISNELHEISKAMYSKIDQILSSRVEIDSSEIYYWSVQIERIMINISDNRIQNDLMNLKNTLFDLTNKEIINDKTSLVKLPMYVGRSIILTYTLWYGGQNFSITLKEMEKDLNLKYNKLGDHLSSLIEDGIISTNKSGLIVLDPVYIDYVDSSLLFLLSHINNIGQSFKKRRKYVLIQSQYFDIQKMRYNYLADIYINNRSYILDYCQKIFGNLFNLLREEKLNYEVVKRFLIRLSIYPYESFVLGNDPEILKIFNILLKKKAISSTHIFDDEKIISLDKKMT